MCVFVFWFVLGLFSLDLYVYLFSATVRNRELCKSDPASIKAQAERESQREREMKTGIEW